MTNENATTNAVQTPVAERAKTRPRTDVLETADELVLVADVPGAEEPIELTLTEDVLTLRARTRLDAPAGWKPVGRDAAPEPAPVDFERSFRIAADVERETIAATLQNGRLRVAMQKRKPRTARIEVRSA